MAIGNFLHSIVASALPEPCKSIVEWTIRNANQLHPVENAASHFGVLRREIARKLSVGGVVNYTTLRKMGRLLHLGELCGSRGMSLRRARNVLDFTGTVTRSEIRHAAETRDWIASAWHSPLVDNKAPAKAEVPAASPEAAD